MWRPVVGFVVLAVTAQAQRDVDLLLSEARRITGVVVDQQGRPISGATLAHAHESFEGIETDPSGGFTIVTRAPVLVVRKPGFRSEVIRTRSVENVRLTLRPVDKAQTHADCRDFTGYSSVDGWGAVLWFREVPGVEVSEGGGDSDYGYRDYRADSKAEGPRATIQHRAGPMWGNGTPLNVNVWSSVSYEESVFEVEGARYVEAKGTTTDGRRWRYLGRFGESASYRVADEATARLFDRVMDGACIQLIGPRR